MSSESHSQLVWIFETKPRMWKRQKSFAVWIRSNLTFHMYFWKCSYCSNSNWRSPRNRRSCYESLWPAANRTIYRFSLFVLHSTSIQIQLSEAAEKFIFNGFYLFLLALKTGAIWVVRVRRAAGHRLYITTTIRQWKMYIVYRCWHILDMWTNLQNETHSDGQYLWHHCHWMHSNYDRPNMTIRIAFASFLWICSLFLWIYSRVCITDILTDLNGSFYRANLSCLFACGKSDFVCHLPWHFMEHTHICCSKWIEYGFRISILHASC